MTTPTIHAELTIQVSAKPVLSIPKSLSARLGVRAGEKVSVQVRGGVLRVRKNGQRKPPARAHLHNKSRVRRTGSIMNLAGIIKGKPGTTINVEEYTNHHGYEQFERPPRDNA